MRTFNKRLQALIADGVGRIQAARTREEILVVVQAFRKFERKGRVGFDHAHLYSAFFMLAVVSALAWLAYWIWPSQGRFEDRVLGFLALNGVIVLAPLAWAFKKENRLEVLSDQIAEKWLWLELGLTDQSYMAGSLWQQWRFVFGEFLRGDEDQHLKSCMLGTYRGTDHEFEYVYYGFEYTMVNDVTIGDPMSKRANSTQVRRVVTRYGIVCDFPYALGVAVVGGGGEFHYPARWKTASPGVNSRFNVHAESEQEAARLLSPVVVMAIEKAAPAFASMNLEINRTGKLCLSFGNDLLKVQRHGSLAHPFRFERALRRSQQAAALTRALELIHTLLKYSDNNFARG